MRKKLITLTALALAFCLAVLPVAYADSNSCNKAKSLLMNCLGGQCNLSDNNELLNKLTALTGKNIDLEGLCQKLPSVNTKDVSSLSDMLAKFMGNAGKADPVQANDKPVENASDKPVVTESAPAPEKDEAPEANKPEPTKAPADNNDGASATQLEKSMVAMVNEERAKEGLAPLQIDAELTAGARAHSKDMAANNYFSHTSPTEGTFSERVDAADLNNVRGGAENIARYGSVEKAHVGLMNSEGHRKNIMNKNYTRIGIGIVWDADKNAYCITQWFGR